MLGLMKPSPRVLFPFVVGTASVAIGIEPLVWLVKAQSSPAQAKIALARVGILSVALAWSLLSGRNRYVAPGIAFGVAMLTLGLGARTCGLALGVNHVGAVALVGDLYAACWLLDLPGRKRPASPLLLAAAAALCLPVDRPLYRLLGFPAQELWRLVSGSRVSPELLVDVLVQGLFLALVAAAFVHRPRRISWDFRQRPRRTATAAGVTVVAGCVAVVVLHLHAPGPIDKGAALAAPPLPLHFAGRALETVPLSANERDFFAAVGGNAAKGRYGELSLLVVESRSPLRHLHSPTWCLAGLGHDVKFLGYADLPFPAARYRGTSPEGIVYEVESTFVSSAGDVVPEISEAIWRWLLEPRLVWRSVQLFGPAGGAGNWPSTTGVRDLRPFEGGVAADHQHREVVR